MSKRTATEKENDARTPRLLAYALPRARGDTECRDIQCAGFTIHDVPLGAAVAFPDYDGVVVFCGAFETVRQDFMGDPQAVCLSVADLDLRERELISAIQQEKFVLFLLQDLPRYLGVREVRPYTDLFRRIADKLKLEWHSLDQPSPMVESSVSEFTDYIRRFGTGYLTLCCEKNDTDHWKTLGSAGSRAFGLAFAGKLFFLPSAVPQSLGKVLEIVTSALAGVLAYRQRMSTSMPAWVNDFAFTRENGLKGELADLQQQVLKLEGEIDGYGRWKGALCLQSDPLVEIVVQILERAFGVKLTVDEKYIEDAVLLDGGGTTQAVFEIKGVKGNFTRANVNQVDSHRERLKLPSTTPGVLIMNTMMSAGTLAEKDEVPHPDIIKKAVVDHVLLIRTLDLLRYAEGVENGSLPKEGLLQTILTESGWLKVEESKAQVVKA